VFDAYDLKDDPDAAP